MADTERVLIGTIGRPHGLKGELTVFLRTDEPDRRFAAGTEVLLGDRPVRIASCRRHGAGLLLVLDAVTDRTAAEALRGTDIWALVPADEVPPAADEFYDRQLTGLEVRDASGAAVGRVRSIRHAPAQDLLVVDVAGAERLVPFVDALVPVVDLDAGYLQVADVRGLLDEGDW